MRRMVQAALTCIATIACGNLALAESSPPMMPMDGMHQMMTMHMPQQISVVATGTVDYVPDIAKVMVGVRAQAPTAAAAADNVNRTATQTIAAITALGLNRGSIKTSAYNLEYRESQPAPGQPVPQAISSAQTLSATAARTGQYVASETLQVTAPVALAGKVLDAAIGAGANETYGLSYQSSKSDALYRSALAKAVQSAHDTAVSMAKAAHVTLDGIQSISNSSQPAGGGIVMQAEARMMASAPVMAGTDSVSATVYVVYRVK